MSYFGSDAALSVSPNADAIPHEIVLCADNLYEYTLRSMATLCLSSTNQEGRNNLEYVATRFHPDIQADFVNFGGTYCWDDAGQSPGSNCLQ